MADLPSGQSSLSLFRYTEYSSVVTGFTRPGTCTGSPQDDGRLVSWRFEPSQLHRMMVVVVVVVVMVVVAFFSRARILGECSTIHSPPAL